MLVLTRKAGEQILIGDNIRLTLVRVQGNRVRVGIDAPDSVRVVRGELEPREVEPSSPIDGVTAGVGPQQGLRSGPRSAVATALGARPTDRRLAAPTAGEAGPGVTPSRMRPPAGGRPFAAGVGDQRIHSAGSASDSRSDATGDKSVSIAFWRATRSRASIS